MNPWNLFDLTFFSKLDIKVGLQANLGIGAMLVIPVDNGLLGTILGPGGLLGSILGDGKQSIFVKTDRNYNHFIYSRAVSL